MEARTRGAGSDVPVELARNAFCPLRLTFVAVAVFSGAITLAVATVPGLYFAYRQPPLHIALETAASLIALLAAFSSSGGACSERRGSTKSSWQDRTKQEILKNVFDQFNNQLAFGSS
jgi:hypothetical protein